MERAVPDPASQSFAELLESVSARSPTPGGGAVAAAVGALAAALGGMVVSFSVGRKSLAEHAEDLDRAGSELARARVVLLELASEDAAAYAALSDVFKLDKKDPSRAGRLSSAAEGAITPPLAVVATCTNLLRLFESLCGMSNRNLHGDLAIAAVLADAAVRAARWMVLANLPLLATAERRTRVLSELERQVADSARRAGAVERACQGE